MCPGSTSSSMPQNAPHLSAPGNCSAFIATGSYTKDGKIVIAHSNWSSYADGSRWVMVFDIVPAKGHRILMDGLPGVITSNDDFGINDAGIMSTETTITQFVGWNVNGKPEFMRSRKALQYAGSIDEYVAIMKDGNNGGYANDWLIGDRKTGEVAYLELGLKNTPLWRTKDGYFMSSNFPRDPALIKEETTGFNSSNLASSMNARHRRGDALIAQNKGSIDTTFAEHFLSDHLDSYTGKVDAAERSLCGHVDKSPRGVPEWDQTAYDPFGAVQGKVTDSDMAAKMSFIAHAGHPCGEDFLAAPFLAAHPEYQWMSPILKDMKSGPWTVFAAQASKNSSLESRSLRGAELRRRSRCSQKLRRIRNLRVERLLDDLQIKQLLIHRLPARRIELPQLAAARVGAGDEVTVFQSLVGEGHLVAAHGRVQL